MNILQMVVVMSMIWMNGGYAAGGAVGAHLDLPDLGSTPEEKDHRSLDFSGVPVTLGVCIQDPCPNCQEIIVFAYEIVRSTARTCCALRRCCCCECCNCVCDALQKIAPDVITMKRQQKRGFMRHARILFLLHIF